MAIQYPGSQTSLEARLGWRITKPCPIGIPKEKGNTYTNFHYFCTICCSIFAKFGLAVIKSASSEASPEGFASRNQRNKGEGRIWKKLGTLIWKLNFHAVIKSAACAASPTAWGAPGRWLGSGRRGQGAPQTVWEAALVADLNSCKVFLSG